ncbi:hypothetical protein IJT93_07135 [bacterium]|nr:hypothetical protein [bacterium]
MSKKAIFFFIIIFLGCLSFAQAADTPEKAYQEFVNNIRTRKFDFHSFSAETQDKVLDKFIEILKSKAQNSDNKDLQFILSESPETLKTEFYKELEKSDSFMSETFRSVICEKLKPYAELEVKDTVIKGNAAYLYLNNGRFIKINSKDGQWSIDMPEELFGK